MEPDGTIGLRSVDDSEPCRPEVIEVEITSRCNRSCTICPRTHLPMGDHLVGRNDPRAPVRGDCDSNRSYVPGYPQVIAG
jgi:hypothetical protein